MLVYSQGFKVLVNNVLYLWKIMFDANTGYNPLDINICIYNFEIAWQRTRNLRNHLGKRIRIQQAHPQWIHEKVAVESVKSEKCTGCFLNWCGNVKEIGHICKGEAGDGPKGEPGEMEVDALLDWEPVEIQDGGDVRLRRVLVTIGAVEFWASRWRDFWWRPRRREEQ